MSERDELTPFSAAERARAEVEARIPHRAPFLFVDEIVASDEGRIVVRWTADPASSFYEGHYPGQPVTPGVILCEHSFQAGALLVSDALGGFRERDGVPVLTRLREAKFKRIVDPGDTVETTVEVTGRVGPAWYLAAKLRVGGKVCVQLEFVLSATEAMARVGEGDAGSGTE